MLVTSFQVQDKVRYLVDNINQYMFEIGQPCLNRVARVPGCSGTVVSPNWLKVLPKPMDFDIEMRVMEYFLNVQLVCAYFLGVSREPFQPLLQAGKPFSHLLEFESRYQQREKLCCQRHSGRFWESSSKDEYPFCVHRLHSFIWCGHLFYIGCCSRPASRSSRR